MRILMEFYIFKWMEWMKSFSLFTQKKNQFSCWSIITLFSAHFTIFIYRFLFCFHPFTVLNKRCAFKYWLVNSRYFHFKRLLFVIHIKNAQKRSFFIDKFLKGQTKGIIESNSYRQIESYKSYIYLCTRRNRLYRKWNWK